MIRKYKNEDLPAMMLIARRAWKSIYDMYENAYGKELFQMIVPNRDTAKDEQLRDHAEKHPDWIYVCEENGKVAGFVTFGVDHERKIGQIGNNAADPDCGLKGVGQLLYAEAFKRFKEEGMLYAQVRTGLDDAHSRARRAYERAGFDIKVEDVTYFKKL